MSNMKFTDTLIARDRETGTLDFMALAKEAGAEVGTPEIRHAKGLILAMQLLERMPGLSFSAKDCGNFDNMLLSAYEKQRDDARGHGFGANMWSVGETDDPKVNPHVQTRKDVDIIRKVAEKYFGPPDLGAAI